MSFQCRRASTPDLRLEDLDELIADSVASGWRLLERLAREWLSGENRFARPGEALFLATAGERIVGVCGLNIDPHAGDPVVGRLRRLYVLSSWRRRGVGRSLVAAALAHAAGAFREVRLRTGDQNADAFYRALGFARAEGSESHTHVLLNPRRDMP